MFGEAEPTIRRHPELCVLLGLCVSSAIILEAEAFRILRNAVPSAGNLVCWCGLCWFLSSIS